MCGIFGKFYQAQTQLVRMQMILTLTELVHTKLNADLFQSESMSGSPLNAVVVVNVLALHVIYGTTQYPSIGEGRGAIQGISEIGLVRPIQAKILESDQ